MEKLNGHLRTHSQLASLQRQQFNRNPFLIKFSEDCVEHLLRFAIVKTEDVRSVVTNVGVSRLPVRGIQSTQHLLIDNKLADLVLAPWRKLGRDLDVVVAGVAFGLGDRIDVRLELVDLSNRVVDQLVASLLLVEIDVLENDRFAVQGYTPSGNMRFRIWISLVCISPADGKR